MCVKSKIHYEDLVMLTILDSAYIYSKLVSLAKFYALCSKLGKQLSSA